MTDTPESQRQTADRLSRELGFPVTRDQVRGWVKRGFAIHDPAKLTHQLRMTERPPRGLLAVAPQPPATPSADTSAPLTPEQLDQRLTELQAALLGARDYESARTVRTQISGVREMFRIQTDRSLYILRTAAASDAAQAATASVAAWENLEAELPPRLEGMTSPAMAKELREFSRLKCRELAELFGTFAS
jgi:hypothetical protein